MSNTYKIQIFALILIIISCTFLLNKPHEFNNSNEAKVYFEKCGYYTSYDGNGRRGFLLSRKPISPIDLCQWKSTMKDMVWIEDLKNSRGVLIIAPDNSIIWYDVYVIGDIELIKELESR